MNAAQFLIDTSALARFMREDAEHYGWDQAAAPGLIATCPIDDRAYDRAWQVQEALIKQGKHRSAGAVDLVLAATAELQGL